MAKRTRDATARSRVRAYLGEHGSVRADNGGATTVLREAIAYQGSAVAFIQLLTSMDEAGELVREIRGKRTYAISRDERDERDDTVARDVPALPEMATRRGSPDIDYDELAKSLLRELGRVLVSALPADGLVTATAGLVGNGDLARELTAERDRLQAERDDYAVRLESSRRQLNALAAIFVGEDGVPGMDAAGAGSAGLHESDGPASERAS